MSKPKKTKHTPAVRKPMAALARVDEQALIIDLRSLIHAARQRIAVVANSTTTLLYWHLGRRLLTENFQDGRAEYGKQILATVSQELTAEFGRGFTYTEVTRMIRFAEDFQDQQIVASLAQQLSWGHFRVLLPVKEPFARDFYAELCRIEHWDVRTLRKKIGGMLFQRTALAKKLQQVIAAEIGQLRAGQLSPDVVFRDPYFLDLLGLTGAYSEADLESAILREIGGVLLELGQRLALSRDQEEIHRLATEGQVVEKAADLLPAPTVRSKQAQGIALGDNPKMIQALKGRPNPCHNHLPVFTSISSSVPRIVNDSSPAMSAILSMPTWQPSCKIGAVPRCSSILSKTMFTSCSIWHAPSLSAPRSKRSKKPRQNGSRRRAQHSPVSPGRPDMPRLPYPSPTFQPCGITSPDNKSITGRSHSKTNTEPSWCDTELISMNDTSGINASPWVAPSGLHSLSSARPRALPWAGVVGPVGAQEVARLE